jgi:hypothetical protein
MTPDGVVFVSASLDAATDAAARSMSTLAVTSDLASM